LRAKKPQPRACVFFLRVEGSLSPNRGARPLFGRNVAQEYCACLISELDEFCSMRFAPKEAKRTIYIWLCWAGAGPAYWRLFQVVAYFSLLWLAEGGARMVALRAVLTSGQSFDFPRRGFILAFLLQSGFRRFLWRGRSKWLAESFHDKSRSFGFAVNRGCFSPVDSGLHQLNGMQNSLDWTISSDWCKSRCRRLCLCSWVRQVGAAYLLVLGHHRTVGCFLVVCCRVVGLAENGLLLLLWRHSKIWKRLGHHRTFPLAMLNTSSLYTKMRLKQF